MNNIVDTLKQCHEIVWRYREQLQDVWAIPPVEDCLLFAFCELAESVDAYLRSKPEYARNRDKDLDVLDELSDCALMLLTAYGREWREDDNARDGAWPKFVYDWHYYITDVARVIGTRETYGDDDDFFYDWRWYAMTVVEKIATHPGMDLPQRLTARLERIKAKRWREQGLAPKVREAE